MFMMNKFAKQQWTKVNKQTLPKGLRFNNYSWLILLVFHENTEEVCYHKKQISTKGSFAG